ncbi:AMP-binding protein [Mycobacterium sp. GA-2829]|uniref:AMP-binding protein n=1 Tax=Mycobacterium sp. GA-2829 TaxID=1772283 RepID=UPI00073FB3A0|nr:AMP-binding protein [Mycobacterium sp. GA-2829]KUI39241.1 ATP-dependent acyl-CoA ligase [Mycobacterium sp. GA-2829]
MHDDATLTSALAEAATRWPDRTFLKIEGRSVTFAEFEDAAGRLAGGLREVHGVGRGDRVGVFMRNSLACEHTWFASNRLGAAWVPINTEFKGLGLEHAVRLADAKVFIADADLRDVLVVALASAGIDAPVVTSGSAQNAPDQLGNLYRQSVPPVEVRHSDVSALLYTSGTTGRSKACVLSHRYFTSQARIAIRDFGLRQDDVLYCPFPLFHADATALTTVPALLLGATAAISRRFSASRFWAEVRETGATVFDFMGATLSILAKAEPRPDDADNPVRLAWGVPVPESVEAFEKRFGLTVVELYGSVEGNIPITQRFDQPRVPGSCGRVVEEFEVRIADDVDEPVTPNTVGELLIRPKVPYTTYSGYYENPAATTEAQRNMWFHSGDLAKMDEDGNVYFIGRKKEAIRRRGENISAFEVEESVREHPAVLDCAAYGVASDLTEEDVMVAIVLKPGAFDTSEDEIWSFCHERMARFQVPRYIEFVDALPKTPTGKVEKFKLQEAGVGPSTREFELPRPVAVSG